VHTALSFDAAGQGTRARPRDAYAFARGDPLGVQPFDSDGKPSELVRLRRPLDFAVVTDHSDLLGETQICQTPSAQGYDSWMCTVFRRWPRLAYAIINSRYGMPDPERMSFCGERGLICIEAAEGPWKEIQEAAEEAYDRSPACGLTTFVGYEWTGMPDMANIHRNLIFRNDRVQARPTTFAETPTAEGLWDKLESECLTRGDGCDVIAIPHNSNVSAGQMFRVESESGQPLTRDAAARRSRLETMLEITQHKGDSECRVAGLSHDELCAYEKLPYAKLSDQATPYSWHEPPPLVYAREALAEGLVQHARVGANPFRLGLVGSTDTHLATAGFVEEDRFLGHAAGADTRRLEVPPLPDSPLHNPGGLAVLWAEENSRDALFEAMRRREAYGTSGPRMVVRFFGGWSYPPDLCARPNLVELGYEGGVPMGGELPERPETSRAPRLVVAAWKDPGTREHPGTRLERLQVVKAWAADGAAHERVYDVAGAAIDEGTVDLSSCAAAPGGSDSLCTVWEDPDFDPAAHAMYYVRLLEVPTCRWLAYACNVREVDCRDGTSLPDELAVCCDPTAAKVIRERAWSSPIWYSPGPAARPGEEVAEE
jgi:hypothetical protein